MGVVHEDINLKLLESFTSLDTWYKVCLQSNQESINELLQTLKIPDPFS